MGESRARATHRSPWGPGGHSIKTEDPGEPGGGERGSQSGPYLPLFDPAQLEALRNAGRTLSPRHWALVVILTRTGMELEAVGKLTWRDVYPDKVFWKPSKGRQTVSVSIDDEELAYALQVFVTGQRKSSDMLDYWIKQIREGTKDPELRRVTGITLRLTCAVKHLSGGQTAEEVSKDLRLPLPAVLAVTDAMRARGLPVADE